MSEKDRREAGITPAFIRFSVGTEDVRDIIEDLDQALAKLPENIVNTHDEKLEAKVTAAANGIMDTYGGGNGDVDFIDADISLSKSNVPLGRQTAVGNW
ncbi:O-acetylhomoserine (thiol)-lyase [Colletotrichum tabaci]